MEKFKLNVDQEYDNLQQMLKQTSELFERLVRDQGQAICLQYTRWTLYLCLVRQNNGNGECCGVRWAKYRLANESRKVWYNGWLPGKVPASTIGKIGTEDRHRFRELDNYGKQLIKFRSELVLKKKRIVGTFQSVRQTDSPRLQELLQNIEGMQEENVQETGVFDPQELL